MGDGNTKQDGLLRLGGMDLEIRLLSALEAADCLREADTLRLELAPPGEEDAPLAEALGECGALAAACLYRDGSRAFSSGREALAALRLDELAAVRDAYEAREVNALGAV